MIHRESVDSVEALGERECSVTNMDGSLKAIRREALQRQARQRIDRIDELRAAKNAADSNLTQREIAELLATSQAKVHRLLKALEPMNGDLSADPEELLLRAFVYDSDRIKLVADLKDLSYSFGQEAPYPHEGRLPGTWDQVVAGFAQGMLNKEEFNEVRLVVGR